MTCLSVCVCVAEIGRQAAFGLSAMAPVVSDFKKTSVTALRKGSAVELA